MTLDMSGTVPVRRFPEAAHLAELLRTSLIDAVGEGLVGALPPFVVSPRTPQQVEAVLRVCAHHRLALSVVSRPTTYGAGFACRDVDVVLSLGTLIDECALPARGITARCAEEGDRAAVWPKATATARHESR